MKKLTAIVLMVVLLVGMMSCSEKNDLKEKYIDNSAKR